MTFSKDEQAKLEEALDAEDWKAARAVLRRQLRRDPEDHWILTRIGPPHYEERRYAMAGRYGERAYHLAPFCPLVLWDLAGSYDMSGQSEDALALYRKLRRVVRGPGGAERCDEGPSWRRSIAADAAFRIGLLYARTPKEKLARRWLERYLEEHVRRLDAWRDRPKGGSGTMAIGRRAMTRRCAASWPPCTLVLVLASILGASSCIGGERPQPSRIAAATPPPPEGLEPVECMRDSDCPSDRVCVCDSDKCTFRDIASEGWRYQKDARGWLIHQHCVANVLEELGHRRTRFSEEQ